MQAASRSTKSWGTCRAFNYRYADLWLQEIRELYLAGIAYSFNRRFNLKGLLRRLLIACIGYRPQLERLLLSAELCC